MTILSLPGEDVCVTQYNCFESILNIISRDVSKDNISQQLSTDRLVRSGKHTHDVSQSQAENKHSLTGAQRGGVGMGVFLNNFSTILIVYNQCPKL